MDEIFYNGLNSYFHALEMKGYMPYSQAQKLLILGFYKDFVSNDYSGLISSEDYRLIERALNCLYGSTCLIPYPDYLKMGKLHLNETTEFVSRLKAVEDANVLKAGDLSDIIDNSDIMVIEEDKD